MTSASRDITADLHSINQWEYDLLRGEVACYLDHGIALRAGATVLDVGANIGVFSAHVFDHLDGDVTLYAFEPGPEIYQVLHRNARELFHGRLTVLPYGLSSREHHSSFTYFPAGTLFSSTVRGRANFKAERRRIAATAAELARQGEAGELAARLPFRLVEGVVWVGLRRLRKMTTHRIQLRPLSAVIDEHRIDTIDLLKIDVEGAELQVLHGIQDRHWPSIGQAVIEVEQWDTTHREVQHILHSHGFTTHAEQGIAQHTGNMGMIYATRGS